MSIAGEVEKTRRHSITVAGKVVIAVAASLCAGGGATYAVMHKEGGSKTGGEISAIQETLDNFFEARLSPMRVELSRASMDAATAKATAEGLRVVLDGRVAKMQEDISMMRETLARIEERTKNP